MDAVTGVLILYRDELEEDPSAAAALGFTGPQEWPELWLLRPSLTVAAARWEWQCGDAQAAFLSCSIPSSGLVNMMSQLGGRNLAPPFVEKFPPRLRDSLIRAGLLPANGKPCQELADFLRGARWEQKPGEGLELVGKARAAAEAQGPTAGMIMLAEAGSLEEQRLYGRFPAWLDQLVSQLTGRRVTLVIEPEEAQGHHPTPPQLACQVYLEDAASGEKQLFGWQQPGDVGERATYEQLQQQAQQRGVTDPDLLKYCAGVEPYEGPAVNSSSSDGTGEPCVRCGQRFPKLKVCAQCKTVAYCSRECQLAHWKAGHKAVCKKQ
jgi:hypothetical protein